MKTFPFDIVFLDLTLPDSNGMEILSNLKGRFPESEVIIITGHSSIDSAIEAIKKGAYHYVAKPFKLAEIRFLADSAREKIDLRRENQRDSETDLRIAAQLRAAYERAGFDFTRNKLGSKHFQVVVLHAR